MEALPVEFIDRVGFAFLEADPEVIGRQDMGFVGRHFARQGIVVLAPLLALSGQVKLSPMLYLFFYPGDCSAVGNGASVAGIQNICSKDQRRKLEVAGILWSSKNMGVLLEPHVRTAHPRTNGAPRRRHVLLVLSAEM